jgi:hypothetical protein
LQIATNKTNLAVMTVWSVWSVLLQLGLANCNASKMQNAILGLIWLLAPHLAKTTVPFTLQPHLLSLIFQQLLLLVDLQL